MGEVKERQQERITIGGREHGRGKGETTGEQRQLSPSGRTSTNQRSGLIGTTSRGWFYGHTYVLYVKLQHDAECFIKTTHFTIIPLVNNLCYNNVEQGQ